MALEPRKISEEASEPENIITAVDEPVYAPAARFDETWAGGVVNVGAFALSWAAATFGVSVIWGSDENGDPVGTPAVPAADLSFGAMGSATERILVTALGLGTLSTPKSLTVDTGVVEILWDAVTSGLVLELELDTGVDAAELRVETPDVTQDTGPQAGFRSWSFALYVYNIDGAAKTVTLGTDTGFAAVETRDGFTIPTLTGAGTKMKMVFTVWPDGSVVWEDASEAVAP